MSQDQRALLLLRLLRDSYEQPVIKRGGACVWQQRALTWAEVRESGKLIMGSVSPAIVTFGGETLNPVTSRRLSRRWRRVLFAQTSFPSPSFARFKVCISQCPCSRLCPSIPLLLLLEGFEVPHWERREILANRRPVSEWALSK